jgi:hypothetical protein
MRGPRNPADPVQNVSGIAGDGVPPLLGGVPRRWTRVPVPVRSMRDRRSRHGPSGGSGPAVSAPTQLARTATLTRDDYQCLMCGAPGPLEWNHRAAVGMGGSQRRPGVVEGVILCHQCNHDIEADAALMKLALSYGLKIRKWADPSRVPVYVPRLWQWFRLEGVVRHPITAVVALDMMHAVYGDQYFEWRAG